MAFGLSVFKRGTIRREHWIFAVVGIFALVGLLCSLILSVDKLQLLEHPTQQLSCSLNAFLNCTTVMNTPEASLLGFPNSFIGLAAYGAIFAIAVGGLMGTKYARSFMLLLQLGLVVEILFAYWLFFDSVFTIRVLCPFCLAVTFSSTVILMSITRYNILEDNLYLTEAHQKRLEKIISKDYDKMIFVGWVVLMIALVLLRFPGIFSS
jgi:uncharacterized membrane protein